jgi:hypothetical protein
MNRITEMFYGVEIPRVMKRGGKRLAIGGFSAGPMLFWFRKQAIEEKNRLVERGFRRARVVMVRVTYRWS